MPRRPPQHGDHPRRADVVELRVHGVSGAPPSAVLHEARVRQVAGDGSGGFHRRAGADDTDPDGLTLEAYRWADLPSGTVARTLSMVFLLPFMLSNLAVWMRPAGRRAAGVTTLCRLLALNLTVVYVVSIAGVALDLLAWRCLGAARCRAPFDTLAGLDDWPVGQRLAVLTLLPIAAIVLLRLLGTRRPRPAGNPLWAVEPLVARLRAIHVAAAFAVLDLLLLTARRAGGATPATTLLWTLSVAVLLFCVGLLVAPGLIDRAATAGVSTWLARAVGVVAVGLSVATLVAVASDGREWPSAAGLPGYGAIAGGALLGQMALLVLLCGLVLWRPGRAEARSALPRGAAQLTLPRGAARSATPRGAARSATPRGAARSGTPPGAARSALPRGLGATVIAAIAVGLTGAFSAGLVYQAGDLLGGFGGVGGPPLPYRWTILAVFLHVVAGVLACAAITLLSRRRRCRAAADITARDFPAVPPEAIGRLRLATKAVARARFTEWLGVLATVYAALAVIGLATSLLGGTGRGPEDLTWRFLGLPAGFAGMALAGGTYIVAAVVLVLLSGGVFAYRTAWFRRHVGILWDLGTFWPRAAHPFAPPSYADRAVPELADRITQLAERHAGVVLCGHSHGSALLALAVLRLPPHTRRRVALLTYGSPLDRLYARLFPAYLNRETLREVGERIGWRWLNLWRDTDPVGGWIFAAHRPGDPPPDPADPASGVDRRLRDPRSLLPAPGERRPPPVRGHHPDESEPEFRAALRELAGRLRCPDGG
ncbi:hypothetical protein ACGFIW_05000 [Micromonospora sp. NPDC048935]|uniref:hypothetical protein n=1 Tax=Micromonospora sp. NPDC048935 TaxID=3364262 RepID=UPI00371A0D41